MSRFSAKPGSLDTLTPQIEAVALEAVKVAGLDGVWLPMLVLTQQDDPHAVLIVGPDKPSVMLLHALAADQGNEESDPVKRYLAAAQYVLREAFCDSEAPFVCVGFPKGFPVVLEFGPMDFEKAAALFHDAAKQMGRAAEKHEAAKKVVN
jgi:hypothetical protein